jgi:hypothetical protein
MKKIKVRITQLPPMQDGGKPYIPLSEAELSALAHQFRGKGSGKTSYVKQHDNIKNELGYLTPREQAQLQTYMDSRTGPQVLWESMPNFLSGSGAAALPGKSRLKDNMRDSYMNNYTDWLRYMESQGYRFGGTPEMAYGGQSGYGLNLNARRSYVEGADGPQDSYGRTLAPVDREDATYEAEQGEVIVGDLDRDGRKEMLTFGGKPHSQGGTPANQEGFIFSKTKSMALRGPIVEKFGKKAGTRHTIADLAKQYDLTKLKAILDDPKADPLTQKTAELLRDQYESKLADLAMVQESMKGFPQGVPDIAAKKYGSAPMGTEVQAGPMAAYGGMYKMQEAGQTPAWLQPWTKSNTVAGRMSRTTPSLQTIYDPATGGNTVNDDYQYWRNLAGRDFTDTKDMQTYVFDALTKQAPDAMGSMLGAYGLPNAETLADGIIGARTAWAMNQRIPQPPTTTATPTPPPTTTPPTSPPTEAPPTITDYEMQTGEDPRFSNTPGKRLPYNRFDVLNLMTAASTPVKSYAPRMFQPDVQEMQGFYDQPDYNPLLAAANTRAQMNQTFGNASAAMSANTYNPELTQGLIQETQRARANNLQTANNLSQANTQIRNQANMINAQLAQDNYDKFVRTQEQTDIANKLKWRKDVMPAAQNMVNNRVNMERFNALYPQYEVSGNDWRVNFEGGKNFGDRAGVTTGFNYGLREFFAENPDLKAIYERGDDAKKLEIAKMVAARQREVRSMMGRNPANISGNMNNPFFNSMMGIPQVGPTGAGFDEFDQPY